MKTATLGLLLFAFVLLLTGCDGDEPVSRPRLVTTEVSSITGNSAVSGGSILSDGGGEITARGVCWSLDPEPTTEDFKSNDGQGTGDFSSNLTGLSESTTYHVRAYATNSAGTAYGEALSFSTFGKPHVQTEGVSELTTTTANVVGRIISDGNAQISERGICWGTSPAPDINDNKAAVPGSSEYFAALLEGLSPNTTYYARTYAVNDIGISYGGEVLFVTFAVMDVDGNGYYSVTIGTQVWLQQDLKVTTYRNGDPIPNVTDGNAWGNLTSGAYCDYNNDPSNGATYGRIYNWYAVGDSREIAPEGWHVATKAEWDQLVNFLGGDDVAGGKLKEQSTSHWQSPNTGATNATGFTAIPGGGRGFTNVFGNIGIEVSWWTATESASETAYGRYVTSFTDDCHWYSVGKESGSYVRCVKD